MIRARDLIDKILLLEGASNVLNVDEIEGFTRDLAQHIQPPEVKKWLTSNLRNYIIKDYPYRQKITKKNLNQFRHLDLPEWASRAIEGGQVVEYISLRDRPWQDFRVGLRHITDYLLFQFYPEDHPMPRDLQVRDISTLSYQAAFDKSQDWMDWLNSGEVVEEDPQGIEEVMKLSSGFRWVKVISRAALNREGKEMGHCVGSYAEKVAADQCTIYSLRDGKNEPHATVEVVRNEVVQIKGKQNQPVVPKYCDYVIEFLNKVKFGTDETDDLDNIGLVRWNEKLYRKDDAPLVYWEFAWVDILWDFKVGWPPETELKEILSHGINVDIKGDADNTALLLVSRNYDDLIDYAGNEEANKIVNLLIEAGADVNAKTRKRYGPLALAAGTFQDGYIIEALLDAGAEIDAKDSDDYTPIMRAVQADSYDNAALLAERGANLVGLEEMNLQDVLYKCKENGFSNGIKRIEAFIESEKAKGYF
jgi:hypothetical protein